MKNTNIDSEEIEEQQELQLLIEKEIKEGKTWLYVGVSVDLVLLIWGVINYCIY